VTLLEISRKLRVIEERKARHGLIVAGALLLVLLVLRLV
jgi:hypothetical protein